MNAQLTEITRLITNLIRTGTVAEVDRVNWLMLCAGNSRIWWKSSIGEQVVLFSLGGNLETAFALPAFIPGSRWFLSCQH